MNQLSFLIILLATYFNTSFANVWTTTNTWNNDWENKYSKWVEEEVKTSIFKSGRYADLNTDCADAVYTIRAIYAYENGLPFEFRNPNKYGQRFTNKISQFNRHSKSNDLRFRKFLNWMHRLISTFSLGYDTYSPKIDEHTIKPGMTFLLHKVHVYMIKKIDAIGIPQLISSTVPRKIRNLDTDFMVPTPDEEEMTKDLGGFRAWRWPKQLFWSKARLQANNLYSDEQYLAFKKSEEEDDDFEEIIAFKLSGGVKESTEDKIQRYIKLTMDQLKERVEIVQTGHTFYSQPNRSFTSQDYYNHSTPSRDSRLVEAVYSLMELNDEFIMEGIDKKDVLKTNLENEILVVAPGIEVNVYKLILKLYAEDNVLSGNPRHSIERRWGL
jgi:hypothetical protein